MPPLGTMPFPVEAIRLQWKYYHAMGRNGPAIFLGRY